MRKRGRRGRREGGGGGKGARVGEGNREGVAERYGYLWNSQRIFQIYTLNTMKENVYAISVDWDNLN